MHETDSIPRRAHVLVVEDDDGLVALIKKQLSAHGCDCEHASTGQEALSILSEYTPTLMLLDFTLPDMTAERMVEELHQKELLPSFVMISGSEDAVTAVNMMKLGARDYLVKDANFLSYLVPLITRVLNELDTEERLAKAEAALRESEERLRSTIASLDDLIYVLDKSGVFIDFYQPDKSAQLSIPSAKFLDRPYWEAGFPAEMVKLLARAMADIKENGEVQSFDYQMEEPKGVQWYSAKVSMRRDANGNFDGITIVSRDITERKVFEEKLFYLSTHDTLTGLYNRAYFETELERLAKSRHLPVSVVICDLDGLKQVNDSRGHAAGDNLLKVAGKGLLDAFRGEDVVARVGGDEFAILLPYTDETTVQKVLQRAKEFIASIKTTPKEGPLRLSFGWATAENGNDLPAALKKADKRMYQDKNKQPVQEKAKKG